MPYPSRMGFSAAVRWAMVSALLELACGGMPQDEGDELRQAERQALRVDDLVPTPPWVRTPGPFTNNRQPRINGTAGARSTVQVLLNGKPAGTSTADAAGDWGFTPATKLPDGLHVVAAAALDAAGNPSDPSEAHSFTVDTLAPHAPEVKPPGAFVCLQQIVIHGTAEAGSTVHVWLNGAWAGKAPADHAGAWSFTPATPLGVGNHTVFATASDKATNISVPSAESSFLIFQQSHSAESPFPPKESHYGWGCATSPASPATWALLALTWWLGRRRLRAP